MVKWRIDQIQDGISVLRVQLPGTDRWVMVHPWTKIGYWLRFGVIPIDDLDGDPDYAVTVEDADQGLPPSTLYGITDPDVARVILAWDAGTLEGDEGG